jgi:hypothetical protein
MIMIFYSHILTLLLLHLPNATARTFTVVNLCPYTIWHVPTHFYCLLRRVPRSSDLSLTAMQACSGWCLPATSALHRLLNALSGLHRPLRRTKCAAIPNGVCFQHLFITASLIYLYISRWESPPYTSTQFSVPDNWKSGRIWVRIFLLSLPLRAPTRASFWLFFRVAETVTLPRSPE